MKLIHTKICGVAGLILALTSYTVEAATIQSLTASQMRVAPGTQVTFTIELSKDNDAEIVYCGAKLNFGDGASSDMRLEDSPTLKYTSQRTFQNPGKYTVVVSGKDMLRGLKSVFGCRGSEKQVTIEVVDIEKIRIQQELQRTQLENERNKVAADNARKAELEAKEQAAQEKTRELERKLKELEEQAKKNAQQAPKPSASPPQPREPKPASPTPEVGSGSKKPKADSIL